MNSIKISKIKKEILLEIKPTKKELAQEKKIIQEIKAKINKAIKKIKVKANAIVAGSIARNTHLKHDKDIDFFIQLQTSLTRKQFESTGMKIAKQALTGIKWQTAYSEHPYLKAVYKTFEIELVPCYKISNTKNLKSAVDRTPFHLKYLQGRLTEKQKDEVRLLKQFLKELDLYGADLRFQGFSGYLTELMIVKSKSIENLFKESQQWIKPVLIDLAKHYSKKETEKLVDRFNSKFIVIDPVDKNRNVASALSEEQLSRFQNAGKAFLEKPELKFFRKNLQQVMKLSEIKKEFSKKNFIALELNWPKEHLPDIVFGQLKRLERKIKNQLQVHEFKIKASGVWSNEKTALVVFNLEKSRLPLMKIHCGPHKSDLKNVGAFLKKHKCCSFKVNELGKIHIKIERKYETAHQLLHELLADNESMNFSLLDMKKAVIANENNLLELAEKELEFNLFLSRMLKENEFKEF